MVNGLPEVMSTGYTVGYSRVRSQGPALKQHPVKTTGWVQGEGELCRWHHFKLISFCLPRLSGGLMKGVVMLLGVRPEISALHPVWVLQELFFDEFDFSARFRNNAWIVLLVRSVTLKGPRHGLCQLEGFSTHRILY